jgi:hypothetical protein
MSTARSAAAGASRTFASNHGADNTQVVFARTFNHRAFDPRCVPEAFVLAYPLDAPFSFAGAPASLCWEVHVTSKTQQANVTHDAFSVAWNPPLLVRLSGRGCRANGAATALTIAGGSSMSWATGTGTLLASGSNAPANGPGLHALGLDKDRWLGLTLPFLLAGTSGAPSGACFLHTDVLATVAVAADAGGAVASAVPVPLGPHLHGRALNSQFFVLDLAANPWGVVTSPLCVHGFVAPTPAPVAARIWLAGSLGPIGSLSTASWLITRLD